MKPKYFREVERTSSGKPWSQYNLVPTGLEESAIGSCEVCDYRISKLKELFVRGVVSLIGANPESYDAKDYCSFTPNCNRKKCLLDKLVLERREKSTSSLDLKKLLNSINLNKTSEQNEQ